ncbi:MAG TPA: DUF6705 family protein [Flavobacterium sp.]|nr:DUF6705 family protein [Flavobacterium sp.]
MKKLYNLTALAVFAITSISCKAQTYNLEEPRHSNDANAYYKDVNDVFGSYTGTWFYTHINPDNTVTSFKLILQKAQYKYDPNVKAYYDIIYGVYEYIDHDVIIKSTLNQLNPDAPFDDYDLFGHRIMSADFPPKCNNCAPNEKRVRLSYFEADRDYISASIILRHTSSSQTINVKVWQERNILVNNGNVPVHHDMSIPFGEYTLTQQ